MSWVAVETGLTVKRKVGDDVIELDGESEKVTLDTALDEYGETN